MDAKVSTNNSQGETEGEDNRLANALLLLYRHPLAPDASTIMEHVLAFRRHSRFRVWNVNTELGIPMGLNGLRFKIIVLHYSLFGSTKYPLNDDFLRFLEENGSSYKIAMFQDEYYHCQQRFAFLNRFKVDCVYTLLEPKYFKKVYGKYTAVPDVVYNIPGYVSDDLIALGQQLTKPDNQRKIDIGYRSRTLPFYMGEGSQEKQQIGALFREHAAGLDLKLDIEMDEQQRIYGRNWYRFLADCRAVLGVEAGVSIFDLEDEVLTGYERLMSMQPTISFEEMSRVLLYKWEDNIPYRTISPRHFEAAALRACQILFEGRYSGVMEPMVHYIPLKKDFSNFEKVVRMFKDDKLRHRLTENAFDDLIASGSYSYRTFIEQFDRRLLQKGFSPEMSEATAEKIDRALRRGRVRRVRGILRAFVRSYPFPGRPTLFRVVRPIWMELKRLRSLT